MDQFVQNISQSKNLKPLKPKNKSLTKCVKLFRLLPFRSLKLEESSKASSVTIQT